MNTNDDAGLIQRIAHADQAALGLLYDLYGRLIFSIACQILSDEALAEEVTQDVFIQVWNKAATYQAAQGKVLTWLTSIARHRAIDSRRRSKTEVATFSRHAAGTGDGDEVDLLAALPSGDAGPLELLQQAAQARDITHCMGELSAEQQQCLALAYYQGLSHAEVAEHLFQPLGTVKSWVRRALLALKDCLGRAAAGPAVDI